MLYVDIVRPPPIDPQASDVPEAPSKAATKKGEDKEKKGGKKKEDKKGKQQTKEEATKDAAPQEKGTKLLLLCLTSVICFLSCSGVCVST